MCWWYCIILINKLTMNVVSLVPLLSSSNNIKILLSGATEITKLSLSCILYIYNTIRRKLHTWLHPYLYTYTLLIQFRSNSTYHHTEGLIPHVGVWNLERHDVGCDFGCSHNKSTGTLDVDTVLRSDRRLYSRRCHVEKRT